MPQISIPYAVARVRMLAQQALDKNKLDRLIAAKSYKEAKKLLSEMGWGGIQGEDEEKLSIEYLSQAYDLVKKITPAQNITDSFLIKYDIHNAKTLIKARELKQKVDFLSDNGIIPLNVLEHAVTERVYKGIAEPILLEALEKIEKLLAVEFDPFMVDVTLDQAMYDIIFSKLNKKRKKAPINRYFTAKVDLLNAHMLLRSLAMDKDFSFFAQVYVPHGSFTQKQWESFFAQPEQLVEAIRQSYGEALARGIQAGLENAGRLPALEKMTDDYLTAFFVPYQKDPTALESFLGYLIGVEREAAAVRLIMAAKANDFTQQAVTERMREMYGQ